jgi:hypothetical protein
LRSNCQTLLAAAFLRLLRGQQSHLFHPISTGVTINICSSHQPLRRMTVPQGDSNEYHLHASRFVEFYLAILIAVESVPFTGARNPGRAIENRHSGGRRSH